MFRIKESIHVNAPMERCFLLSTSVPLVRRILGLHPVRGRSTGLIQNGDRILWRGWKFGLPAFHETLITGYDAPRYFQDTMARGMFRRFHHDHHFQEIDGHTLMWDIVYFSLPFGFLGRWVGKHILVPHVLALMARRFELLKKIAEGPEWQQYLADAPTATSAAPVTPVSHAVHP